ADRAQKFSGLLRMESLQRVAPLEIAGTGHWVVAARDCPAAQMLTSRGEAQRFRGVRIKFEDPAGQPFRVNQLARVGDAGNDFEVRVARVFLVEAADCGFKASRIRKTGVVASTVHPLKVRRAWKAGNT